MDDLLVLADSEEQTVKRLKVVFKRLNNAGLKLMPSKGLYFRTSLKWLGTIISGRGRTPDPKKIKIIREFPEPKNVKDLQRFLGFLASKRPLLRAIPRSQHP